MTMWSIYRDISGALKLGQPAVDVDETRLVAEKKRIEELFLRQMAEYEAALARVDQELAASNANVEILESFDSYNSAASSFFACQKMLEKLPRNQHYIPRKEGVSYRQHLESLLGPVGPRAKYAIFQLGWGSRGVFRGALPVPEGATVIETFPTLGNCKIVYDHGTAIMARLENLPPPFTPEQAAILAGDGWGEGVSFLSRLKEAMLDGPVTLPTPSVAEKLAFEIPEPEDPEERQRERDRRLRGM